ncbi:hypothetical protein AB205_0068370, partial [Aquarana catesbeiana]
MKFIGEVSWAESSLGFLYFLETPMRCRSVYRDQSLVWIKSMSMEEDPSHMTERILELTLEIIYLLTGESVPPVKSGNHLTIRVPSPHSLKPKKNNDKKILEATKKMIDLLTGE